MNRLSFPVVSHGHRRSSVVVKLFNSRKAMRAAVRRYDRRGGDHKEHDPSWYAQMAACTTKRASSWPGKRHDWQRVATIHLVKGDCGARTISHEAAHAAIYFYQEQVQRTIPDIEREEILCHLVGEITGIIVDKLYEIGCYE